MLVKEHGDGILYTLLRMNETLSSSKLTVVGISNDLYFKDKLDPRIISSLGEEEIVFKPYTAEQIRDILIQRIRLACHPSCFSDSALNLCAALAAAEHGDARRALDIIRASGEVAERNELNIVAEDHVYAAQRKIDYDRVIDVLRTLPLHSKILLYALYSSEKKIKHEVKTGDLYNVYQFHCNQLGVEALTHRRISGLLNELGLLGIIKTKIANLGRYGRTKRIKIFVPERTLKSVFSEDSLLQEFMIDQTCSNQPS